MSMKKEKQILAHNHLVQGIIVATVIFIIAFYMLDLDRFLTFQALRIDSFEVLENAFVRFGIVVVFLYQLIPQVFMLIGTTAIIVRLLDAGVTPIALLFIIVIAKLFGQYLLYLAGRILSRFAIKNKSKLKQADHLMHKYRTIIFILPPFLGFLGDAILFIAGHQRIGFARIAPLLLLGNFLRVGIFVANTTAQAGLPGLF